MKAAKRETNNLQLLQHTFHTMKNTRLFCGLLLTIVCVLYIYQTFRLKDRAVQRYKERAWETWYTTQRKKKSQSSQQYSDHFPSQTKKITPYATLVSSVYDDDRFLMRDLKPLNRIPPILHLNWKNEQVPDFAYDNFILWNKTHSNWTIFFWKDKDIHNYVHSVLNGSSLYKAYSTFTKNIMKMDFFRYVILYTMGGVYADIDVTPLQQLEPVLSHHSCIIAREPEAFPISIAMESTILASNFFMASAPGHPFWPFLMEKIKHRPGYALTRTGPQAVTDGLRDFYKIQPVVGRSSAVFLAPSLYFDPPHGATGEGDTLHIDMLTGVCKTWKFSKKGLSVFVNNLCDTVMKKHRIDFTAMYRHPKYFNKAFVRHGMFNSWNSNSASKVHYRNIKTLTFKMSDPSNLYKMYQDVGPYIYERDQSVLKNEFGDT